MIWGKATRHDGTHYAFRSHWNSKNNGFDTRRMPQRSVDTMYKSERDYCESRSYADAKRKREEEEERKREERYKRIKAEEEENWEDFD